MKCREIMKTDIAFCQQNDLVTDCARLMRDRNIGFIPVCDEQKNCLGTITDRDICIRVVAESRPLESTRVKECMTQEVVACRADDDLDRAVELMSRGHKSRLLVTDESGRLEGVISLSDLVEVEKSRAADLLKEVAQREVAFV